MGLRDGLVRKLVGIGAIIIGLFAAQGFMHDVAEFMVSDLGAAREGTPALAFSLIFFFIVLFASIVYRVTSDNYKIGGVADKVLGATLGFVQGALFASSLLLMMAFSGMPSRATSHDSRLYKPLVNIAPQILDLGGEVGTGAFKNIQDLTRPSGKK